MPSRFSMFSLVRNSKQVVASIWDDRTPRSYAQTVVGWFGTSVFGERDVPKYDPFSRSCLHTDVTWLRSEHKWNRDTQSRFVYYETKFRTICDSSIRRIVHFGAKVTFDTYFYL